MKILTHHKGVNELNVIATKILTNVFLHKWKNWSLNMNGIQTVYTKKVSGTYVV